MHAVIEDGHAAVLAPKGLMPGRPADQSCPTTLSSIFFLHASSCLVGVWPGRPADLFGPTTLIPLLHVSFIQATSFTSLLYTASSLTALVPSKFYTFPSDCKLKMSNGETDEESRKNELWILDETG